MVLRDGKLYVKNTNTSHPILKEVLIMIDEARREQKIKYWVNKLSHRSKRFKRTFLNDLVAKHLIQLEEKKFLGIIPYRVHYLLNQQLRVQIIKDARNDVLNNNDLGKENLVLGLIEACKMQKFIAYDKRELKIMKKTLKQMLKESQIAETIDKTIQEVQAAVMAAIIAATVASTVSS